MQAITVSPHIHNTSAVVLEDMDWVSRHLEGLKKSLGLEQKVLGLGLGFDRMVLFLILKSCNFQDLQVKLFLL
jgi:hypothetical protein